MMPRPAFVLVAATVLLAPLASCTSEQATSGRSAAHGRDRSSAPYSLVPELVRQMPLDEKIGQLFVPAFGSRDEALSMIKQYHVGGFIYFPANTQTPRQTAKLSNTLQRAAKIPLLIGVDEEQGTVSRLPYLTRFPGNMALGATRRPDDVRTAARITGTELRAVGINQDYAPVADVNVNAANPVIGVRSFGSDPTLVAQLVGAAVDGYRSAGVAATAKHFPGHGDTTTDSHTGLPVIRHSRATWEKLDAPPFRAAIAHGVDAIMSAHIVVRGLDRSGDPATLSAKVLTGALRDTLGFQGVIVTDSLRMTGARRRYGDAAAAVRAVKAGADQLLMPPNLPQAFQAVRRAVRDGSIPRQRLDSAVTRILRLKEQRGLFSGHLASPDKADRIVGAAAHKAAARQVAEHSITLVKNEGAALPLRGKRVFVTGPDSAPLAAALRRQGVSLVDTIQAADIAVLTTVDTARDVTQDITQDATPRGVQNAGTALASDVRGLGHRPVVVAALGRPYDLGNTGRAKAALTTYSTNAASINALAKVLTGSVRPTGKLPVAIPHAYGVGHGLTFPKAP
jgi:beta-N-acetylhexosaminidase